MLSNVLKCSLPLTKQLPGAAAGKEKAKFSPILFFVFLQLVPCANLSQVLVSLRHAKLRSHDSPKSLALRDRKRPELSVLRWLHIRNEDLPSMMGGGATCDGAITVGKEK